MGYFACVKYYTICSLATRRTANILDSISVFLMLPMQMLRWRNVKWITTLTMFRTDQVRLAS